MAKRFFRELGSWCRQMLVGVIIAILFTTFVVQGYKVEGASMEPTLSNDERVFVNKFVYMMDEVHRGDIVVFWYPSDPTKNFIKRVIGLPEDWVWIEDGQVYVNGTPLIEGYVPAAYRDFGDMSPKQVPSGYYFVLGDHRTNSSDSRTWGFVPIKYIQGQAFFRFWPPETIGTL